MPTNTAPTAPTNSNPVATGAQQAAIDTMALAMGGKLVLGAPQSDTTGKPGTRIVPNETANPDGTTNTQEAKGLDYLYSQFPNEFEYYACGFELVDSDNKVIAFFTFPVMPESISNSYKPASRTKRTMTGSVISNNPSFAAFDINIAGNFGHKFRRVSGDISSFIGEQGTANPTTNQPKQVNNKLANVTAAGSTGTTLKPVTVMPPAKIFNSDYKTGYGCCKIVEGILIKANKFDDNYGVHRLYFHNFSFNQSFLVEINNFEFSIGMELNRIWKYNISMRAAGPASSFDKNKKASVKKLLDDSRIIQSNGTIASAVQTTLKQKPYNKLLGNSDSKLQQLLNTEIGKRVYQVTTAYQPNVLRAALQLVENPQDISSFLYNAGNSTLNTGRIF